VIRSRFILGASQGIYWDSAQSSAERAKSGVFPLSRPRSWCLLSLPLFQGCRPPRLTRCAPAGRGLWRRWGTARGRRGWWRQAWGLGVVGGLGRGCQVLRWFQAVVAAASASCRAFCRNSLYSSLLRPTTVSGGSIVSPLGATETDLNMLAG